MRLFSYTATYDTGFSPNPFFGSCTLACCKPRIRLAAEPGDWVVGLTPKSQGNQLLYAMRVEEKLTFDQYWRDRRFAQKRPRWHSDGLTHRRGDNIYEPKTNGEYRQLLSLHSAGRREDSDKKRHDLSGRFVLVSTDFHYFGSSPVALPSEFEALIVTRGHKCRFPAELVASFARWIQQFTTGVTAPPTMWKEGDTSWRQSC